MGTLFNQEPRPFRIITTEDVISFIEDMQKISKKTKLEINEVIKVVEILELRRKNDLFIDDGDTFDEQMSGIGEIMNELVENLISISNAITETGNSIMVIAEVMESRE